MKNFKRVLAYVLALIVVTAICPVWSAPAAPTGEDAPQILFKATADEDDSAWANKIGTMSMVKDEEMGEVFQLEQGTSYYALIDRAEPITSGNVVMSWDLKTTNKTAMAYVRSFSGFHKLMSTDIGDEMFESLLYLTNGKVGLPANMSGFTQNSETVAVPLREWQHVDVWFNMDTHVASLYVDGEFVVSETMKDGFDKYCGYVFCVTSNGGDVTYWMDNIYIGWVPKSGYDTGFEFVKGTPSDVTDPFSISMSIDPVGHIFTDRDITVHGSVKNPYSESENLKYDFEVQTEDGKVAYKEEKPLELNPSEEKSIDFNFTVEEYGFYYVSLKVTDVESGYEKESTTRFSVVRTREDGLKNKRQGINSHYISGKGLDDMEELIHLFGKIGMAYNRESVTWAHYESRKGVYALYDNHMRMLNAFKENGISNMVTLGHESLVHNIKFPRTDEEFELWCKYVENLVQDLAPYGIKDFETWNEVFYPWRRGELEPKDYVRMVKETYPIVKKYIPDATFYAFSLAGQNTLNFVEECVAVEDFSDYYDAISYHNYTAMYRPEEGNLLSDLEVTRNKLNELGIGDKPIYLTEYGYTDSESFVNTLQQAQFVVRASALLYDEVPFTTWYVNIEKIDNAVDKEVHFGWLKGWRNQEINLEAKPVFVAMANWNALMADAESNGKVSIFDGGGNIFKYTNGKEDIYAVWKIRNEQELCLDLGVDEVRICDLFGNERTQKTENGILRLSVNESMQYLIGNFPKCEEVKEAEGFDIEQSEINVIKNDTAYLTVHNKTGNDDYTVEADLPAAVDIVENPGFKDGSCTLTLRFGADTKTGNAVKVNVRDKNGNLVWQKTLNVTVVEASDISFDIEYHKSGRWKGVLKITNQKNDSAISGRFYIKEPEIISEKTPMIEIESIEPKMTKLIEFSLPVEVSKDYIDFKGEVVFDDGETREINESSYFTALTPIKGTPTIDGVISPGEYNTSSPMRFNKPRMIQVPTTARTAWNWAGLNDLSAVGYINYDKDYFYLAFEVTDDILGDKDPQGRIWSNDSVQFAFVTDRTAKNTSTEIGMGFVNGEPQIHRYSYLAEVENVIFYEGVGKKEGFEEDTEFTITRNGNKTTYEAKISWIDIFGYVGDFNEDNVYFAAIINENDLTPEGRLGWLEFSPGIGIEKSATLFTKIPVTR